MGSNWLVVFSMEKACYSWAPVLAQLSLSGNNMVLQQMRNSRETSVPEERVPFPSLMHPSYSYLCVLKTSHTQRTPSVADIFEDHCFKEFSGFSHHGKL